MIRMMVIHVFNNWDEFIEFLRTFELKEHLESMEFHQFGNRQIVVRFITGEPDAMKRASRFMRGEA